MSSHFLFFLFEREEEVYKSLSFFSSNNKYVVFNKNNSSEKPLIITLPKYYNEERSILRGYIEMDICDKESSNFKDLTYWYDEEHLKDVKGDIDEYTMMMINVYGEDVVNVFLSDMLTLQSNSHSSIYFGEEHSDYLFEIHDLINMSKNDKSYGFWRSGVPPQE